jgi:coproporphyrinogen III oxidase
MSISKEHISAEFRKLQNSICDFLESEDGKSKFREDRWDRPEGGGGSSRIIENGSLLEKGGVNYSAVFGPTPEKIKASFGYEASEFYATGVSIVLHPQNPNVPIIHMNIRYFEMDNGSWWFGGGIDLTPHYINHQDARFFHTSLKQVCDHHHKTYYSKFKKWADDYFYIKHRNETRGIGGIFFDRLHEEGNKNALFEFTLDIGKAFIPIYRHMLLNRNKPFTKEERQWQLIRRGRYVEFNLVLDRGTKFGLETNGRIESILMSLPPIASWEYDHHPKTNSPEYATNQLLKKDIDWINLQRDD